MLIARFTMLLVAVITIIAGVERAEAQEFRFPAREDQIVGGRDGELIIGSEGITFSTANDKHRRAWKYNDIGLIELPTPQRVRIWTYQDREWMLGKDQHYTYNLAEPQIDKTVIDFLRNRATRPFVVAFATVVEGEAVVTEIAVKHKHRLGGCQGVIKIYKDRISFITSEENHSRDWHWDDIESVGRAGQWQLELATYEREVGGSARSYHFQLKEPLPSHVYDIIWHRVYRPTPLIKPEKEVYAKP